MSVVVAGMGAKRSVCLSVHLSHTHVYRATLIGRPV